jgi:alpha/beta superfamily hydrolase
MQCLGPFRRAQQALLIAVVILGGCGGGGNSQSGTATYPPPRGTLLQSPPQLLSTLTASNLLLELNAAPNQQLLAIGVPPICDILIYHIEYETVGGANEATSASGALMVPTGLGANCTGSRPIVLYAHGTTTDRTFDMTNMQNPESLTLAALFASQGYIVVAPNYAGYDTSSLAYHPFLIADQQSKDMIDALRAARTALPYASLTLTRDDGRLFITGYSEGGYVAMATHRAMQAAGMTVTAAAPMSGPYALAAFVDAIFSGEVNNGAPVSSTLLFTAYQHAYGNIYASSVDVFESQYSGGIDDLLPSTIPRSQLYADGKLPEFALFSATPPAASLAALTPATAPADLAAVFALGFGAGNLLQNSFRLAYLEDAEANPDGGWPTLSSGVTAASPQLAARQAFATNDLRNWAPTSPVLLCGGALDPTVFWFNTQLLQDYFTAHAPPSASIAVLDLESEATGNDPYANLKTGFAIAKDLIAAAAVAQGANDGGASAVSEAYHDTLVPPFCTAAVRAFFAAR